MDQSKDITLHDVVNHISAAKQDIGERLDKMDGPYAIARHPGYVGSALS